MKGIRINYFFTLRGFPSLSLGCALWICCLLLAPFSSLRADGIRPIRGPVEPTYWEENKWELSLYLVFGVLLLAILSWVLWKIRSKSKVTSPAMAFDEECKAIRILAQRGESEEIPPRLSRILRDYLGAKTGIRLGDKTREEFLTWVERGDIPAISSDLLPELQEFMATLDQAKFAGKALTSQEIERLLEIGLRLKDTMEEKGERKP